jgi:hypothetical protein
MIKSVVACVAFWLIMSLLFINQVYGYARITSVTLYAPSQAKVGQEAPVQAAIHT